MQIKTIPFYEDYKNGYKEWKKDKTRKAVAVRQAMLKKVDKRGKHQGQE